MTAPRWIVEAFAAACEPLSMGDCPGVDEVAKQLIDRLPIEAIRAAVPGALDDIHEGMHDEVVRDIVRVLTDGDPEVVQLTELYQSACRALDHAGVPYAEPASTTIDGTHQLAGERPLNLAGRIQWLAQQRPTRIDLQRVEAERDALKASNEAAAAAAASREIGLQAALDGARERIGALEGETEILHESLDSATSDAEHNERELVDLRRRFDDLQRDRDRLARDLNQLQGDLDTSERKLRDAERELQRARHPGSW